MEREIDEFYPDTWGYGARPNCEENVNTIMLLCRRRPLVSLLEIGLSISVDNFYE